VKKIETPIIPPPVRQPEPDKQAQRERINSSITHQTKEIPEDVLRGMLKIDDD
jgi:hypothetical protein